MKFEVLAPTRVSLEVVAGQSIRVVATYARMGSKSNRGRDFPTVLLIDLRDANTGELLTDHMWFNRGRVWRSSQLLVGDVVLFEARSIEYRTGYWGPDPIRRQAEPPRCDYRLTPPENLQILRREWRGRGEVA
jgi:hypothetical protein